MTVKRHIPNFITILNLLCGCAAIVYIANNDFQTPFYLVCLGIFFDFFDGFFARLFKVSSPLGLQLDSLADMVTSGVVPGFLMYKIILNEYSFIQHQYLAFAGFVITAGACYRLANFNIDERQTDHFIGLPTPANALFFMSIPFWMSDLAIYFKSVSDLQLTLFFVSTCFVSAFLMNSEIALFSLKIKNFSFQKYKLQILFALLCTVLLVLLQVVAVPMIIVLYVLVSVASNFFQHSSRGN